jgi:hypothetical protein
MLGTTVSGAEITAYREALENQFNERIAILDKGTAIYSTAHNDQHNG